MLNTHLKFILNMLFVAVIFQIIAKQTSYSQVSVTKPALSFGACSFPSNYHPLDNIIIIENARDDFSTVGTNPKSIELTAPSNFEFRPGTGFAVVNAGGNLSIVSFTCTATTVTIEYNCIQVNINDKMTIIGLEVRAINEASSGIITRTGGTGIIDGLPIGEALSQNLSSTDLTTTPNYYATVNYSSGFLFWSDPNTWECGVVPPNDGTAEINIQSYQGFYSSSNCVVYDEDIHVNSIVIRENANFSPGSGGNKICEIENDLIIESNANLRNIDWPSSGTNRIQLGGDFLNDGFMTTDGNTNAYNLSIEFNGTQPQTISGNGSFRLIGSGSAVSSLEIGASAEVTLDVTFRTNDDNAVPGDIIVDGILRFSDETKIFNGLGNLELNGYVELKTPSFNEHFQMIGSKTINTSSTIEFTHPSSTISTSNIPVDGSGKIVLGSLKNNVSNSGVLNIFDNVVITDTLGMISGNIETSSNTVSIGASTSEIGYLIYQNGYINGILKRWFTGTNSGASSGLYPLSKNGTEKRFVTVEYIENTDGGSVKAEWINSAMGYNLNTGNISTNCNGSFVIENTDNGYWEMTPNDGITTSENKAYNITLEGEGILSLVDECHITAIKRVGSDPWNVSGTHVDNSGTITNPISKRIGASGWSNWGFAGGSGTPLPVELSSFSAHCEEESIQISWTTQSEYNSSHFDLLKSRDGFTWEKLESIVAAGFSNSEILYSYIDEEVNDCYYKLEQFDIDGKNEIFGPIHSGCSNHNSFITTHPNPSSHSFNLIINDNKFFGQTQVEYYDTQGKIVFRDDLHLKDGINLFVIDSSTLKKGIYLLRIINKNHQKVLKHIIE